MISMAQVGQILRPGLRRVFSGMGVTYRNVELTFGANWYATYQKIYNALLREKLNHERIARWNAWLAKRKPNVRARLERLNPGGWKEGGGGAGSPSSPNASAAAAAHEHYT